MANTYHVSAGGTIAKIKIGAGALSVLGIPFEAADIQITEYDEPVHSDVSGHKVPAELQAFGSDAVIRIRLIAWDDVQVDALQALCDGGVAGQLPAMGSLLGTNSNVARFLIDGGDRPYNFPCAKLRRKGPKPSSKAEPLELEIYAWSFVSASTTSTAGQTLYNAVNS